MFDETGFKRTTEEKLGTATIKTALEVLLSMKAKKWDSRWKKKQGTERPSS